MSISRHGTQGTGNAHETGTAAGEGTTLNCPFPAGAGREEILGAFGNAFAARMDEFRPGLVLISAGFDSRIGGPLGHFRLQDRDFADLTSVLLEIADKYSGGRAVSVLKGGYNFTGLTQAVASHAETLSPAAK
jgi:acetoin utilization deacetylase AcuC-like enzyme